MSTATTEVRYRESTGLLSKSYLQHYRKFLPLLLIVLGGLGLRLVVVACAFRDVADPIRHYEQFGNEAGWIARSLASGHGFSSPFFQQTGPTAIIPPVYPFLLSIVFRIFGLYSVASAVVILSLNSLLSALTCIPIYFAMRHTVSERAARFAAIAWAIYPFAIYFSAGRVWEYSLTSLLLTTCFYLSLRLHLRTRRRGWILFGALFGFAVLTNPAVLSLFAAMLLTALWFRRQLGAPWIRNGLFAALGFAAVLTPWTVRNYVVLHVICPVRDSFAYELWSGNNGDTSNPTLEWTHPASNAAEMQLYKQQGEVAYIASKHDVVSAYLPQHKAAFAVLTFRRFIYYWTGFWSTDPVYVKAEPFQFPNVFFCTGLTLFMLLGARHLWRIDRETAVRYLLPIAVFPLTYYTIHPLMDYRQPIEPEIVAVVVMGLAAVRVRIRALSATLRFPATTLGLTLDRQPTASFSSYTDLAFEDSESSLLTEG